MKKFIGLILALINTISTAIYLAFVPNDIVPIHYGADGTADSYGSKWTYLFINLFLIALGVFYAIYETVSQHKEKENKDLKYIGRIVLTFIVLFAIMFWVVTVVAINHYTNLTDWLPTIILFVLGALYAVISNMMPKLKPNSVIGIRISATLNSEYVWKKTHKLAGYTGVLGSFVLIICGIFMLFFNDLNVVIFLIGIGIFIVTAVIIPTIYAVSLKNKEA
jgi:uncharacterized membrane protein